MGKIVILIKLFCLMVTLSYTFIAGVNLGLALRSEVTLTDLLVIIPAYGLALFSLYFLKDEFK